MAARENISKLLQELRGYAEVTNRRALTGASHSLWAPVRPPVVHAFLPRRKVFVSAPEIQLESRPVPIQYR